MAATGISIISYIIGLLILYIVIENAVRRGINHSIVGRFLEEKHGMKDKSYLDDDLDNDT